MSRLLQKYLFVFAYSKNRVGYVLATFAITRKGLVLWPSTLPIFRILRVSYLLRLVSISSKNHEYSIVCIRSRSHKGVRRSLHCFRPSACQRKCCWRKKAKRQYATRQRDGYLDEIKQSLAKQEEKGEAEQRVREDMGIETLEPQP